jgi:hypothetical protein
MERIKLPETEIALVKAIIEKMAGPCTVYVFGYRNSLKSSCNLSAKLDIGCHYFDLLVLSDKAALNGASKITNAIADQTSKAICVSILLHEVTDLKTKQPSQQWFYDNVLRNGQRMALDKANVPYILNHNPQRDLEIDTAYWYKCVAVAQFHLQAAADSEHVDVTLCKIALLNTSSTQLALGLLRVFLGYTPNEFGLKYLLQLCGNFTDLPSQLFHQQTPEAIRRYKMLCAPTSMLNHWTRLNAAEQDFLWLLDACTVFLQLATELVTPELHRLENTLTKTV